MIELKEIGVNELQYLANYFLQNKSNIEQITADFGEIESNNGYGTFFLKPNNPLFKVFWVHCKNDQIVSVGLGGNKLGLSLKELFSAYTKYKEGFSPYDEEYIYVFYSSDDYKYTIKITSHKKLFKEEKIINDIPINGVEIILR